MTGIRLSRAKTLYQPGFSLKDFFLQQIIKSGVFADLSRTVVFNLQHCYNKDNSSNLVELNFLPVFKVFFKDTNELNMLDFFSMRGKKKTLLGHLCHERAAMSTATTKISLFERSKG